MRLFPCLLLAMFGAPRASPAQEPQACSLSQADRQGIDRARQARADALLRGDPEAAASVAPADGVILPTNAPVLQGQAALLSFFRTRTRPGTYSRVAISPSEVVGCGRYAYDWGHFRWTTVAGATDSTKYLWVWRREANGRWVLAVAMWNQDR
jgi:ketosteroid isomerase-like protein